MAGLVPAIHGLRLLMVCKDVDARDKFTLRPAFGRTGMRGHDDEGVCLTYVCQAKATLSSTLLPKRSEERATARPPRVR